MKLLVCGGRDYSNHAALERALLHLHGRRPITLLIHGDAPGADRLAARIADLHGIPTMAFPADWSGLGKAAGPIRNQQMLDEGRPDGVMAFPGGSGTADMVRRAIAAGLKVWKPYGLN